MEATPSSARELIAHYRDHPLDFFRKVLGCEPWPGQAEVIEAIRDHPEVAVKSCHSMGKDWLSARIALWFVYTHQPSLVLTTAPTERQVKGILWQELAIAHASAKQPLGGEVFRQELTLSPDQRAIGFTANDSTRFHGWHSPHIMIILDEAAAVEPEIYTGVDACLASGIKTRRVEIGNPTDPTGEFSKSFKTAGIHKLSYTAFDTPNFTHFGITPADIVNHTWEAKVTSELPAPWLVTPEWVAQRADRWGVSSPLYLSRVMAQFPEEGEDTLIPLAHIEAAQKRSLERGKHPDVLGVDVARYGSDYSVIAHRQGPVVRILRRFGKSDTMETTGHAIRARSSTGAKRMIVDADGLGSGVVDRLRELGEPVTEAHGGASPSDKDLYLNSRAEWFWKLREAFESGDIDLDPADDELAAQLSAIRWKPDSRGRVTIEKKEDMRKRGMPSPDDADAVAMTYHAHATSSPLTPHRPRDSKSRQLMPSRRRKIW